MKYGLIPENLFERLALGLGKIPVPAADALFALIKARCLMAGVRLGLFEALRAAPLAAAEAAARCRLDAEATELLLRTLTFAGYLKQRRGRFTLSRLGRRSLIRGGAGEMTGFLQWNYRQWEMLEHLEELLRSGRGVDFHQAMKEPGDWESYQRAMLEIARFDAPALAARVLVPRGARRLLDLAGSHGLLGAELCRRHPPLKSTVLDLPQAVVHARGLARAAGIDALVEHRAGDLLHDDYGGDFDVVLLANILHHFREPEIGAILDKARQALNRGGTIAVWEIEAPLPGDRAGLGDGAALFFRLSSTARCYGGKDYASWLERAGFGRVRVIRPRLSPANVLVMGRSS